LYVFPEYIYNHLKTPAGLSSIKCLTSLRLGFVNVTGDVIEHFLINCPLLERLVVERSASLESIKVVASSPLPLKHLEILHCDKFESVEMIVWSSQMTSRKAKKYSDPTSISKSEDSGDSWISWIWG
ncbi:hypothetical protein Tsubulata_021077, partial [Turnera subulata]